MPQGSMRAHVSVRNAARILTPEQIDIASPLPPCADAARCYRTILMLNISEIINYASNAACVSCGTKIRPMAHAFRAGDEIAVNCSRKCAAVHAERVAEAVVKYGSASRDSAECRACGCAGLPGARHEDDVARSARGLPPCPERGRKSGPSGKHTTKRASVPDQTADDCVELGTALGVHWHDAPREALRRLQAEK